MKQLIVAVVLVLLVVLIFMLARGRGNTGGVSELLRTKARSSTENVSSNNYAYWLAERRTIDGKLIYDQYKGIDYEHRDTGLF